MSSDAMKAAEQVIRGLIDDNPDLPIRAEFYRGIKPGWRSNPLADPTRQERLSTPAVTDGWFVLLKPHLTGITLSAWEPDILGGGIIGGLGDDAQVSTLDYPKAGSDMDVEAVRGPRFEVELLGAIREKATLVAETRSAAAAKESDHAPR